MIKRQKHNMDSYVQQALDIKETGGTEQDDRLILWMECIYGPKDKNL